MSLALVHALELPGKLRLSKEHYIVTQTIYYPGFTIGGIGEALAVVAALALLLTTPSYNAAFWWTLIRHRIPGESSAQLLLTDEMRRPVSDGMLYASKYPRARGTEKKETGNEEG